MTRRELFGALAGAPLAKAEEPTFVSYVEDTTVLSRHVRPEPAYPYWKQWVEHEPGGGVIFRMDLAGTWSDLESKEGPVTKR